MEQESEDEVSMISINVYYIVYILECAHKANPRHSIRILSSPQWKSPQKIALTTSFLHTDHNAAKVITLIATPHNMTYHSPR